MVYANDRHGIMCPIVLKSGNVVTIRDRYDSTIG